MTNIDLMKQFHEQLFTSDGSKCLEYLRSRKISNDTIQRFQIGWCPPDPQCDFAVQGRLTVPLLNIYGEVSGFAGRIPTYFDKNTNSIRSMYNDEIVEQKGENAQKYKPVWIHQGEGQGFVKRNYLYGYLSALPYVCKKNFVIVVEGEFDLWACYQGGIKNAVAMLSSNLNSYQVSKLLMFCENIILMFDGDHAGKVSATKAEKIIKQYTNYVSKIDLPEGEDPYDCITNRGVGVIQSAIDDSLKFLSEKAPF